MHRLSSLIRTCAPSALSATRGPKKKGGVQAKIQSNDIVNIFKQRPDPEPRDIKEYPIFVQEMSISNFSVHQFRYGIQCNLRPYTPNPAQYKTYIRAIGRQRFKAIRAYQQLDWMDIEKDQNYDVHHRTSIYDFFSKSKEELDAQQKAAEEAAALQDSDDDF